jgi:hypothetical protein
MKITKSQLKQIIKEELEKHLNEFYGTSEAERAEWDERSPLRIADEEQKAREKKDDLEGYNAGQDGKPIDPNASEAWKRAWHAAVEVRRQHAQGY